MCIRDSRYFADVCRHLDLEELIDDERFDTAEHLMTNAAAAGEYMAEKISKNTFAHWCEHLVSMEGPWAPVQNPNDILLDPQMEANGYLRTLVDADGVTRQLIANPVQFDETPPETKRGPLFAEHTDEVVRELGKSDEELIELKIAGVIT